MLPEKKPLSIITSLPPILGISNFTIEQIETLKDVFKLQLIGFYEFYPPLLKIKKVKYKSPLKSNGDTQIFYILSPYNPFSWIITLRRISSPVVLFEWWNVVQLPSYLFLAFFLKKRGVRVFLELHNPSSHETIPGEKKIFNRLVNLADRVIVHTRASMVGIRKKDVAVIPYGYYKCSKISSEVARKALGIPMDAKVLLFFGNLRPYKGLDIMLDGFLKLAGKYNDLWLIVAGRGWNDIDRYISTINSFPSDIKKRIIFKPEFISDNQLGYYFGSADLLVLPYKRFDSQSGVIMLSICYELPYIVSNVRGLTEFALNEQLIFEPLPDALASMVQNVLCEKDIRNVKKLVRKRKKMYTWVKYREGLLKLYSEVYD